MYDLIGMINELPRRERSRWIFGYTKAQFVEANKRVKSQLKYRAKLSTYVPIVWDPLCKLTVLEIEEKDVFIFDDQVVFYKR